jgi:small GTP-binding protein
LDIEGKWKTTSTNLFEHVFKILVAGEGGVGKTTLLLKYVNGTFCEDTSMTIGIQFHHKTIQQNGIEYSLQLWDFGGQDRFRFMLPSYAAGAKGAMLLYDTTRMATLENLTEWVKICRTHDPELPILFVGTKLDIVEDRSVPSDMAKDYLTPLNMFDYIEVSSKTGENVDEAFNRIVARISARTSQA